MWSNYYFLLELIFEKNYSNFELEISVVIYLCIIWGGGGGELFFFCYLICIFEVLDLF